MSECHVIEMLEDNKKDGFDCGQRIAIYDDRIDGTQDIECATLDLIDVDIKAGTYKCLTPYAVEEHVAARMETDDEFCGWMLYVMEANPEDIAEKLMRYERI